MVHHVTECDAGVGIGEANGSASAEVTEASGIRTERAVRNGWLEPEAERGLLAEHGAPADGLRGRCFGQQIGREVASIEFWPGL